MLGWRTSLHPCIMTVLASYLPFSDSNAQAGSSKDAAYALPSVGTHVVVSDTLNSPAEFVLGHFVFAAVGRKRPVSSPLGRSCSHLRSFWWTFGSKDALLGKVLDVSWLVEPW